MLFPPTMCLRCGSLATTYQLHGEPDFSPELTAAVAAGRVALRSCVIRGDEPSHVCRACGHAWRESADDGPPLPLAWYLARGLTRIGYPRRGLVPEVIEHEGLGFYGIQFRSTCALDRAAAGARDRVRGRVTIAGDVENWVTGSPGDHGLPLADRDAAGEDRAALLAAAVAHLDAAAEPRRHARCAHARRGPKLVLAFDVVCALVARDPRGTAVTNDLPAERPVRGPAPFVVRRGERAMVVRPDATYETPDGAGSLWADFEAGASAEALAERLGGIPLRAPPRARA